MDDISEIPPNKQTEAKKLITKNLEKKHVVDKVWSAQNETEALNLLRCDIFLFPQKFLNLHIVVQAHR